MKEGKSNRRVRFHQFLASMVLSAFTLEAYLNHLGPKLFRSWKGLERLGPSEKLEVSAELIGVTVDRGKRPWQTIQELFEFRNTLAHGKTERLKATQTVPLAKYADADDGTRHFLKTKWEQRCTARHAKQARTDVERIVTILHDAAKVEDAPPFTFGLHTSRAELLES